LAGYGDRHFKVEKRLVGERTVTGMRPLEGDERVEELAQMLGAVSDSTRESAREILVQVEEAKALQLPGA
jgi:DNA repair protein RecN (Recombination protein N)